MKKPRRICGVLSVNRALPCTCLATTAGQCPRKEPGCEARLTLQIYAQTPSQSSSPQPQLCDSTASACSSSRAPDHGAAELGTSVKSLEQTQSARRKAMERWHGACRILPREAYPGLHDCGDPIPQRSTVRLWQSRETGRCSFEGTRRCGSVWLCGTCALKISEQRRQELNALLAWAREIGAVPVMLTLTMRHDRLDKLDDLVDTLKSLRTRHQQRKSWRELRARLVGTVTATEVTGGNQGGWHPHLHIICLVRAGSEAEAVAAVESTRADWLELLAKRGRVSGESAFQVQGAGAAGRYVTKGWGAAEELTLGDRKSGRAGWSPTELLDLAMAGDARAEALFCVYARVFKGKRQLVWSRGLKEAAGLKDMSDTEAAEDAEDQDDRTPVADIPTWLYIRVRARRRVVDLLEHVEAGGDVWDYLAAFERSPGRGQGPPPPRGRPPLAGVALMPTRGALA